MDGSVSWPPGLAGHEFEPGGLLDRLQANGELAELMPLGEPVDAEVEEVAEGEWWEL
jgi:hypothetical protein